jgi:hypothetical protein
MGPDDLEDIMDLDQEGFGADRGFFIQRLLEQFPQFCMVSVSDEQVTGFIMGQRGHGVVSVGPWLSSDLSCKRLDLLHGIALYTGDSRLRLGVLEKNTKAAKLFRSLLTFEETESSWRMVMGDEDDLGLSARLVTVGSPSKG